MRVRKWPVVGLLLAGLWLLVRNVELAPRAVAGELLVGLVVGLPMAFAFRRMYHPTIDLGRNVRSLPTAAYYVVVFLWEVVTANLDVAYRVLHPSLPIEPDVVEIPLRVETDAAVTTLANSITLTPGTLTMEHDEATNTLYVHGIIGRRTDRVVDPIRRWEDLLLVVFDEDADPGDPPPAPAERAAATGAAERSASIDAADEAGDRSATAGDGTEPTEAEPKEAADSPEGGDGDGR